MVETLRGAGHCDRVLTSRRIIFPQLTEETARGKHIMVLHDRGRRAEKTLKQIIKHDILCGGSYEHLGGNVYLVDRPKDGHIESVSLDVEGSESRVFFVECSPEHENHWGRCTADGFSCGILDMDVWQKILEGSGPNDFTVSRSYHMDCEPDWTLESEPDPMSEEQQAMLECGLPLNFGQSRDFSKVCDDAILVESCIVEKDYDRELNDLNSSTERLTVSESPPPEADEVSGTTGSDFPGTDPAPGSLSEAQFRVFWLLHGERLCTDSWRAKYGTYMSDASVLDQSDCADEGICRDLSANNSFSQEDKDSRSALNAHPRAAAANGTEPESDEESNANDHSAAWSKLWREHAWEVYLQQMNRLLKDEVPLHACADVQEQQNISMGAVGEDAEGAEAAGHNEEDQAADGESSFPGKRSLSLNDFGLVTDGESCSIDNRLIKNHKLKKIKKESHNHKRLPLTTSADALEDAPKDARLAKYWAQRYRLFRKFDDGIRLNETAWFSVTPEKIAEHVAARMCPKSQRKSNFVIDAFCGVGGDAVQLGLRSQLVLAIDIDRETIEMAKHNAAIYGVEKRLDFIQADMNTFVPRISPDAVLFTPPWGGPEYKDKDAYDLSDMEVDLVKIFRRWQQVTPNIALIVPRNTKVEKLCELGRVELEQNLLNKKIKTLTAYYGDLICK
ncbi:uncharacterized protein LOC100897763 [Galendromus occidentalis]|uniref:Trimethylguanosine synthase n=1 Tax=Galendromus occidentalis TaxID=34638 RepID=A0AAJ6QMF2_9ACAR|nr:uncharacterized protein LOC100897763 [Galendromus occidentalis]